MKDKLNERLILLATAQECMTDVADKMDQWNSSQLNMEKSAYDSMNMSDHVLNMSKEGKRLVNLLQECCNEISVGTTADKYLKMITLLEEVKNLFHNIHEASSIANDISHQIEGEVAFQKDIGEEIKNNLIIVGESIDSTLACTEFIIADF